MKNVTIITDGSCLNNGRKGAYGGWASILKYGTHRKEIYGSGKNTTNNRMELMAVLEGAKALTLPCEILVITDSTYVCGVLGKLQTLAENNWYCSWKNHPKNLEMIQDLWQVLSDGKHSIKFQHIKGHSGDPENERADALATSAAKALKAMEELNAAKE